LSVPALSVDEIAEIKKLAAAFNMSVADFARNAMRAYADNKRFDLRLSKIEEASPEESAELLALIDSMSEEDHEVVRIDRISPTHKVIYMKKSYENCF